MMYVDGFILPVKAQAKEEYTKVARAFARVSLAHGATRVVENWSEDVPEGEVTSFGMAVKLAPDEVACFSWIEYPDKATRDTCMTALMAAPEMDMPDFARLVGTKRMIYGGFEAIVIET